MEYRKLGRSDLEVGEICLGSMIWGTPHSAAGAQAQNEIAVCNQRPFVTSSIIGATGVERLAVILGAAERVLGEKVLADIQPV